MITALFFITMLTLTTNTISEGWPQWTEAYTNKLECELVITKEKDKLIDSVKLYLKNKFIAVKKIECMTYDEAVERNTALGH